MMDLMGNYRGHKVYRISKEQFAQHYKEYSQNTMDMYVIDRLLVFKNAVIGQVIGTHVNEVKTPWVFMENKKEEQIESQSVVAEKFLEVVKQEYGDIKFEDYTKVVDKFFADLEAQEPVG